MRATRFGLVLLLCVWGCATTVPRQTGLVELVCSDRHGCEESCAQKSGKACSALGLLLSGSHQAGDRESAVDAYQAACDLGELAACTEAGDRLLQRPPADRDGTRAARLFSLGCDGGLARACAQLGAMHARGDVSGKIDGAQAVRFYSRGCSLGHAVACNRAGIMYERGSSIPQDRARALAYFRGGCERANAEACTNAGALLVEGHKMNADDNLAVARHFFTKGCSGGDCRACDLLRDLPS